MIQSKDSVVIELKVISYATKKLILTPLSHVLNNVPLLFTTTSIFHQG
jgi:Na+/H+ antiporter NhaD/arsenite permease-like protein